MFQKIRFKLILGFLVGVLSIGLFSIYSQYRYDSTINSINEHAGILKTAQSMAMYTRESLNALNRYQFIDNATELDLLKARYAVASGKAENNFEALKAKNISRLDELRKYSAENRRILDELIYLHDSGLAAGSVLKEEESLLLESSLVIQGKIEGLLDEIVQNASLSFDATISEYELLRKNTGIILVAVIFYSAGLAIFIANSLGKPISSLKDMSAEVGKGNLDVELKVNSNDELGELARDFNKMAENLKVLDKEKDEFIAIAAHELKNPIAAIKSYSQLMESKKVIDDKHKLREYVRYINGCSNDLFNLTVNLVDSSRLRLGKFEFVLQEINLNRLFKDIDKKMGVMIKERKIKPVFFIQPNLPLVKADPDRLMQVVRNLIVNATHFTPQNGTIEFRVYRKESNVEFAVKDTGTGIPKDKQAKIFSRFYQADNSGKTSGSGLGLSISKGIVEMMGGKIWFESAENIGTTFYFSLPAAN